MRLTALIVLGCTAFAGAAHAGPAWTATAPLSEPRTVGIGFSPKAGKAIVVAGQNSSSTAITTMEVWAAGAFSKGSTAATYAGLELLLLPDGRWFFPAGDSGQFYDVGADTWSTPAISGARTAQRAVVLATGKILIIGGRDYTATPNLLVSCLLGDPTSGMFTATGNLAQRRAYAAATRLGNGKVLVAGGAGDPKSAELYDPSTGTWSTVAPMTVGREDFAMITTPEGNAMVIGGDVGAPTVSTEVFDQTAKTWSAGPAMKVPRYYMRVTQVGSAWIVTGGADASNAALSSAEMLDASAKSFSFLPPMSAIRAAHVAIALDANRLLVAGGTTATSGASTEHSSAEILTLDASDAGTDATTDVAVDAVAETGDAATDTRPVSTPDAGAPTAVVAPFKRCSFGTDCASGFCVEGVCCDSACTGNCHSCALPWAPGVCTEEPTGIDLKLSCGAARNCLGTCGPGGACIGAGPGTTCAPSRCEGPSTVLGPATCASAGATCHPEESVRYECAPFACIPAFGTCAGACATSVDCAPGFNCDTASGKCIAPPPESDGGCAVSTVGTARAGALLALLALVAAVRRRRVMSRGGAKRRPTMRISP